MSEMPMTIALRQSPNSETLPSSTRAPMTLANWTIPHWAANYRTNIAKLGIVVPMDRSEYFWNDVTRERFIRFPAIIRDTGTFVLVIAPADNACPETILRDCSYLSAYQPNVPQLVGTGLPSGGVPCSFEGLLLQELNTGLERVNMLV
jgi:hypothetical protein